MTENTGFRFYRVAYSYEPDHIGWCIYEQDINTDYSCLIYIDGPWPTETKAQAEMILLNKMQGLQLEVNNA